MTVKQISVFLENKPGRLAEFTDVLRQKQIDMRALSIAETPDFGIVRMIVDDPFNTVCVLKDAGYISSITPVLAVAVPDAPGSLCNILKILGEAGINLEYTYAFITRNKDLAYMILRVEDNDRAVTALTEHNVKLMTQDELYKL